MLENASEGLRRRLGMTAQTFARSAVKAWSTEDIQGFYLNAGTALELGVKARLCGHSVMLLGPNRPGWFKQVLRVVRDADVVGEKAPVTVSGSDALERLIQLEPDLSPDLGVLVKETLDRCNMVKHVGTLAEVEYADRVAQAAAFVKGIDLLVQVEPEAFWAEQLAVAESLVQEAHDAVEIRVATATARARERLTTIAHRLDELIARARAEINADIDGELGFFSEISCPICGSPARAFGELIDNGDVDIDWNPDGVVYSWNPAPTTIVASFRCDVCEFALDGRAEVAVSGVPPMVENLRVGSEVIAELSGVADEEGMYF